MDTMALLQQIFEVCIIPLLGVLTSYLIVFIKNKAQELKQITTNDLEKKYIELLQDTVIRCVIATNQTYVEALKNQNAFTKEAQEKAFKMTYESIMVILNDEAKSYLSNVVGDLEVYITKLIEAQVKISKIEGE